MSSELFSGMPSINIPRSRWKNGFNVTGTCKHGYLVPVDFIPVLPGDSISYSLRDLTRMQTPISPMFGNIKQHFIAFFVPWRLIWEHTEEFFGANKTSSGYQQSTYSIPQCYWQNGVVVGSLSHYLGKPLASSTDVDADGNKIVASILKERSYYLIWSEYFRAQQVTAPVLVAKGDRNGNQSVISVSSIGSFAGNPIDPGSSSSLMRVAKDFDVFTACTLLPQYGGAVSLPLGTTATLTMGAKYNIHDADSNGYQTPYLGNMQVANSGTPVGYTSNQNGSTTTSASESNLYVDLTNATAAKINDIRYAFAVQKYLERANFAGNYFFGILQVHYGVTSPDSRLQRPEFLGEYSYDLLVHQVTSTAETVNSGVRTSVGNTGAVSVTASGDFHLFDKAFVEPGFVCILRYAKHRRVYSQGIMKEDSISDRFEVYTPELCNLGDDSVKTRELYWKASVSDIFGYQEHWYQYRYRPDRVTGMLDPAGGSSQLKWWTLAEEFTTKPQLNDDFILEDRAALDRALTTGSSLDEYMYDTWNNVIFTREMPVRTIPGLIDHFGAY